MLNLNKKVFLKYRNMLIQSYDTSDHVVCVAESSLAFKAGIGVLIQREPEDFQCFAVPNTQFSIQKVYCCS